MSHQISENWSAPGERQGLWEDSERQGLMSGGTESATETFGGDGSTAIKVGHVKHVLLRRHLGPVHVALLELGELVRVHRRVPVRGVREVVELVRTHRVRWRTLFGHPATIRASVHWIHPECAV